MQIDRYGLAHDYVAGRGWRILFGTDWYSEAEFQAVASEVAGESAVLHVIGDDTIVKTHEPLPFHQAMMLESDEVAHDKLVSFPDELCLYVSDDRDIFYLVGKPERLRRIARSLAAAGTRTYTSLVLAGDRTPPRLVKDFFEHWKDLNIEVEPDII